MLSCNKVLTERHTQYEYRHRENVALFYNDIVIKTVIVDTIKDLFYNIWIAAMWQITLNLERNLYELYVT